MHYDMGFFDSESGRVECTPTPSTLAVSLSSVFLKVLICFLGRQRSRDTWLHRF